MLIVNNETLSEMMFRKMKAYNIDLNKELGFTHLKPRTKTNRDMMTPDTMTGKINTTAPTNNNTTVNNPTTTS
jgi:hypothetical protein